MDKTATIIRRVSNLLSMKQLTLYILLLICSLNLQAQATYPVQVYTQLTPPYTSYLPAYYSGINEKLKVTLINTDMQQPTLSVYLRMKIKSSAFTIETPENVYTQQVELQAGIPMQLSLDDLAVYFKNDNMRISGARNEFLRSQMLPDNFYRFSFEVYEANTHRLLSNPRLGFAQAMIASGEPPILNMPFKGTAIPESNIPSIMFSWTPRHMNSVASAYGTEYEITLVEIFDKQVAPEAAFTYSRPIYTETTRATSFIHTAAQPMLIPGMRYAWRVRAIAREGVEEANVFKNNGLSPISWFDYTVDCKTVTQSDVVVKGRVATIIWTETDAVDYDVQYRKKGSTKWYTGSIADKSCPIYDLKFGEKYEYRVGVRCTMNDAYLYSEVKGFEMPSELTHSENCGILPNINLSNQTPTRELQAKLPILVGDFPVFVTKVSGSGTFTGEGYVGIPYLKNAKVAVTFKNIVVNTDNRLVSGFVETKYDLSNNMLFDVDEFLTGGKGVGDVRTNEERAGYEVPYNIDASKPARIEPFDDKSEDAIREAKEYITTHGENPRYIVTVKDENGNDQKVAVGEVPATIKDKSGNIYEVDEKGNIKQISTKSDIQLDDKTKNIQDKTFVSSITFEAIEGTTKYALDQYQTVYANVIEYDREYKVGDTEAIRASAKLMLPGTTDEIFVRVVGPEDGFDANKVSFITENNTKYEAKYNGTDGWNLSIVAPAAKDGLQIYAVHEKGLVDGKMTYGTLAILKVLTYEPKVVNVMLVPVNEYRGKFTEDAVNTELNTIYNKFGVTVNVKISKNKFEYKPQNGRTFQIDGTGLFATTTADMDAIEAAFKKTGDYNDQTVYLFIVGEEPSTPAQGDMVRDSKFGYLFDGAGERVVAHEIGHGVFRLKHPFAKGVLTGQFKQGELENNLMDYPNGTNLAKLQWDALHVPGTVIGLFEKDGDGMKIIDVSDFWDGSNASSPTKIDITPDLHFMLPTGEIIHFTEQQISNIERIYLDEKSFLTSVGDSEYTYEHSKSLNGQDDKIEFNGRFISFKRINDDLNSNTKEDIDRVSGITVKDQLVGNKGFVAYSNVKKNSDYILIQLNRDNFVQCLEGLKLLVKGESGNYEIISMKEEQCRYLDPNICDYNLYDKPINLLSIKSKTVGEHNDHILKNMITQNGKQYSLGKDLATTTVENPIYINQGVNYKGDKLFNKHTLEELNKKMAYLEMSSGYQLYTMFFTGRCIYSQEIADESAKSFLNADAVPKEDQGKRILCLVLDNQENRTGDPGRVTIGLAFGAEVPDNIKNTIRKEMGSVVPLKEFDFTDRLIATYEKIPKKRVIYQFCIDRVLSEQEKIAWEEGYKKFEEAKKRGTIYPPFVGTINVKRLVVENSIGQALDAEYLIEETNQQYLIKYAFKEEYLGYKNSFIETKDGPVIKIICEIAKEHAKWDFTYYKIPASSGDVMDYQGEKIKPLKLNAQPYDGSMFFDYEVSGSKSESKQKIDAAILVLNIVSPLKHQAVVTLVTSLYYFYEGESEVGASYLAGYGLAKIFTKLVNVGVVQSGKISNYIRLNKTARLVAKELDFATASFEKNLTRAAAEEFSNTKAVEYLLKDNNNVGNYWIKLDQNELLLGRIVVNNSEKATLSITHYSKYTDDVISKAVKEGKDLTDKELWKIVEDVVKIETSWKMPPKFVENVNDLGATFDQGSRLSSTIKGEIYNYYQQQKWSKIEEIFKRYKLNGGWPPANGGYNIVDDIAILKGQKFDRYQDWFKLGENSPVFGGSFVSPLESTPYSYAQRALKFAEKENALYYEIEVLKDLPIKGQSADVIPWFGQAGGAKQIMLKFQPKGGKYTNLQDLIDDGFLKVTVRKSPNGKYSEWAGKEFGKGVNEVIGKIKQNGRYIEYENLAGTKLKWAEQNPVDIQRSIETSLAKDVTTGTYIEGKVANFVKQNGVEIKGFGVKVENVLAKELAGDIDIMTDKAIIEVKKTYNAWSSSVKEGIPQTNKFIDKANVNYFNAYEKQAILYVDEPLTVVQMEKIRATISQDVILVNSLDDLFKILK